MIAVIISLIFSIRLVYRVTQSPKIYQVHPTEDSNSPKSKPSQSLQSLTLLLSFFLVYLTVYVYMFGYRMEAYSKTDKYLDGFVAWTSCAFLTFDGVSDDWKDVCGHTPGSQMRYSSTVMFYALSAVQPIVFSLLFTIAWAVYKIGKINLGIMQISENSPMKSPRSAKSPITIQV